MSDQTLNLTEPLYRYLLKNSLREPSVLALLRKETHQLPGAIMQISPEQGQFLQLLVQLTQAKKTLDIGTFTGYSALVVALALPKNGKVITCDINVESTNIAKRYWQQAQVTDKIDLRLAPAQKTLQDLIDAGEAETFDFIFIDADKNSYPTYYEQSLNLLRKGGLMAIDNVLWSGRVADANDQDTVTNMFRRFNATLLNDKRIVLSMLPIGDGLTLVLKR